MPQRASRTGPARELAITAARTAEDNNAEDIVVLDLRGISPVTDYFVICSGTSGRQMRTVADEAAKAAAKMGQRVWKTSGMDAGGWILLDFVDVVVHIFDKQRRAHYDLELIWGEAPKVKWARPASQGSREVGPR